MAKDPKESLNKPVQETGSNHQMVKDFPKGVSEVITAEKSTAIEWLEIDSDNEETPPVEEKDGLPKEWADSVGVEDGPLPVIKVSVETQTETEFSEQSSEVSPEPEVEKESAIKATSIQTLAEGKDQLSPGRDVKGKKKKQRPRKKRSSKEKKEAQPTPSSDNTQSWSIAFQFPMIPGGDIMKLVCPLVLLLFFCSIGFTQSSPVDSVEDEYHAYSFVTKSSFANATLDVKKNLKFLCTSITIFQKEVLCNGSWIFLIYETMLLLVTKEKSHYFLETGKDSPNMKYEGVFRDPQSARNHFDPKEAQAAPLVPTRSQQVQQTTNEMPWWQIFLIVVAILVVILGGIAGTVVVRKGPCGGNRQNGPPANQTELECLENSQARNGPELPATA